MQSTARADFVRRLSQANIHYEVSSDGGIVYVCVTGERWEVEFFPEAPPEVEIFTSTGQIHGVEALEDLFARFSDTANH